MAEHKLPDDVREEIARLVKFWQKQEAERLELMGTEEEGSAKQMGYACQATTYRQCWNDLLTAFNLVPGEWHGCEGE